MRGCEKIEKKSNSANFASPKLSSCGYSFLQNPINLQTLRSSFDKTSPVLTARIELISQCHRDCTAASMPAFSGDRWPPGVILMASEGTIAAPDNFANSGISCAHIFVQIHFGFPRFYERQRPPLSYLRLRQYCRTNMYDKNRVTVTAEPITRLGRTFPKTSVHWLPKK